MRGLGSQKLECGGAASGAIWPTVRDGLMAAYTSRGVAAEMSLRLSSTVSHEMIAHRFQARAQTAGERRSFKKIEAHWLPRS